MKESRPVWKRFSLSILYTLGIALLLLVAAGLMVTGPQVIAWIAGLVGLEQYLVTLWTWLRWPLCGVPADARGGAVLLPGAGCRAAFPLHHSRLGALGDRLDRRVLAYGFYVKNFANYNAMYGSIGAIIILLLYFYLSAAVVLFGAELNAVIEHHSEDGRTLASANFRTTTTPNSRLEQGVGLADAGLAGGAPVQTQLAALAALHVRLRIAALQEQRRIAHLIVEGQYLPHRVYLAQAAGFSGRRHAPWRRAPATPRP